MASIHNRKHPVTMQFSVLFLLACALGINCIKLPSNFQKCYRNQKNFDECALKAAQDGLSQLGKPMKEVNLPSLEPLSILELQIGFGKKVVEVVQNFYNCSMYGITRTKLSRFEFLFDKKELAVEGVVPEIEKMCSYKFDGKVLALPIVGEGPSTVILKNINVNMSISYEEEKKENKTFLKSTIKNIGLEPELVIYNFQNLFDGDKQLGDNINMVLNDNWKEVFFDVKEGYEGAIGIILNELFNRFFSKVSMEEALD